MLWKKEWINYWKTKRVNEWMTKINFLYFCYFVGFLTFLDLSFGLNRTNISAFGHQVLQGGAYLWLWGYALGIRRGRGSPWPATGRPADGGLCRGRRRGVGRGVWRGVRGRLLLHTLLLLLLRLQVVQDIRLNKRDDEIRVFLQCCGSGSGIRCLFDTWILDG